MAQIIPRPKNADSKMSRKVFYALFIGIMCAGLVCIAVGLIVRFCVSGNVIALLVSIFTIIFGSIMAGIALLTLLIALLIAVVIKSKINKEQPSD